MIIKRQKDFSSKLKLGTRLQVKAIEKADKKEKERRKEFKKNIESYDEDFADNGFYQDALKLRSGKMTEDEFIAKHPWTAKKKLFSKIDPDRETLIATVDQDSLKAVANGMGIPFDKFKKELKIEKINGSWEIYHPKNRQQWGVGKLNGKLIYAGAID